MTKSTFLGNSDLHGLKFIKNFHLGMGIMNMFIAGMIPLLRYAKFDFLDQRLATIPLLFSALCFVCGMISFGFVRLVILHQK